MGNRTVEKSRRMGYAVYINRSGLPGERNWERVGFLFQSRDESTEYLNKHFPTVKKWQVSAIRLDPRPLEAPHANK